MGAYLAKGRAVLTVLNSSRYRDTTLLSPLPDDAGALGRH